MLNIIPALWDDLALLDTDNFALDFNLKLAELPDSIVGTPTLASNPAGLTFKNVVVTNGVVGFQITDTLGLTQLYQVTCSVTTSTPRFIHRTNTLQVRVK